MKHSTISNPVVDLPVAASQQDEASGVAVNPDVIFQSRIMVIDDDATTTETIRTSLLKAGFERVRMQNDPRKAIQEFKEKQPDIILLDIQMPGINGIDILKLLRSRDETRFVPVIVLTSAIDEKTRLAALGAGANDFINKPVEQRDLAARVNNALYFKHNTDMIKRHADQVQRELEFDSLTQLRNRRSFDDYIMEQTRGNANRPFNLILFDIDKFKSINDFHGHRAGDIVLQHVAAIISKYCLPVQAFAARIGGDEFAVVCPDEVQMAVSLANDITDRILKKPVIIEGVSIPVRISAGVASRSDTINSAELLFDQADMALYESKGKNGSVVTAIDPAQPRVMDKGYLKQGRVHPKRAEPANERAPEQGRILIVDDEPAVTDVLQVQLQNAGFEFVETENDATKALNRISAEHPDLIILDIRMPGINGLEILKQLRESEGISAIPVLVMTSSSDDRIRMGALQLQANDFLTKPANSAELAARVRNSLMVKIQHDQLKSISARLQYEVEIRTNELFATRRETILCLARTAESRDTETGDHVLRVGEFAGIIARHAGMDEDWCSWLELAAQLHDVGKMSIPDAILYKPSKLTVEEFEIMKTHCSSADRIFGGRDKKGNVACTSPLLQMAARIASTHHERWDGTGYPRKLSGTDIPIEGRITSVADVFDALISERKYKRAYSIEKCLELMEKGRGTQFDPDILDAFFRARNEIAAAVRKWNGPITLRPGT